MRFSPDGKALALRTSDTIRLQNLSEHRDLWKADFEDDVHEDILAFSPDGRMLAIATDREIILLNAETGERAYRLPVTGRPECLAWAAGSKAIAFGLRDGVIRVWDVGSSSDRVLPPALSGELRGPPKSLAFAEEDTLLIAVSPVLQHYVLSLTDAKTGLERARWSIADAAVAISPDRKRIASWRTHSALMIVDISTSRELWSAKVPGRYGANVSFTHDGACVAFVSDGKIVRWLKADTGEEAFRLTIPEPLNRVDSFLAFSPDGNQVAVGDFRGHVSVLDIRNGREAWASPRQTGRDILCISVGPGGWRVATAGEDHHVAIWDVGTGRETCRLAGHGTWVTSLAFDNSGFLLASGGKDGTIIVWEVAGGKESLRIPAHKGAVYSLAWPRDTVGLSLISGGEDRCVRLWDVSNGNNVVEFYGHCGAVRAVAANPRRPQVFSASDDRTVKVWERHSQAQPSSLHRLPPVAVSDCGRWVATTWTGVRLWDADRRPEARRIASDSRASALAFSPQGARLYAATRTDVCAYSMENGRLLFRTKIVAYSQSVNLVISRNGSLGVAEGFDALVLFDAETGEIIRRIGRPHGADALAMSHAGEWVAVADSRGVTLLVAKGGEAALDVPDVPETVETDSRENALTSPWRLKAFRGPALEHASLKDPETGYDNLLVKGGLGSTPALAFSPVSAHLAFGGEEGTVFIFDAQAGRRPQHIVHAHRGKVVCVAFSGDGRRVASGGIDGVVAVWDIKQKRAVFERRSSSRAVVAVAMTPDGSRVVAATEEGSLKLWHLASGREVMTVDTGLDLVTKLFFGADGRRLVCATWKGEVKIWDAGAPPISPSAEDGERR